MKKSKDPFEIAFEEQEESPPESPVGLDENESQAAAGPGGGDQEMNANVLTAGPSTAAAGSVPMGTATQVGKNKEEDEDEEDENMDVELGKLRPSGDPTKTAKMQYAMASIVGMEIESLECQMEVTLSKELESPFHHTKQLLSVSDEVAEEQMSRYESFRRSGFQKSNMKRLLTNMTGSAKISIPMTIVVSGIAKMFVGELVETARVVMSERRDTGPIRPCHMREAYRRLKLDGKIPKRSVWRRHLEIDVDTDLINVEIATWHVAMTLASRDL
ncbi:hypothetical protein SASPL_112933 [Salvia splendens]|uniref:TAFII28-like protein domain-containing protein n=1 Tax=Salvia splendens TaxID=180675 RepID=A0A8X8YB35_SALSN|nr:hypothetical protein SASPL_112933 [Salvia splendens]